MGQTMTSVQKWISLFIVLAQLVMNCKMWEDTIYMECHYLNEQRVSSSCTRHDIHSSPTSDYHTTKDAVNYMDSSTKRNAGSLPLHSKFFLLLFANHTFNFYRKQPHFLHHNNFHLNPHQCERSTACSSILKNAMENLFLTYDDIKDVRIK